MSGSYKDKEIARGDEKVSGVFAAVDVRNPKNAPPPGWQWDMMCRGLTKVADDVQRNDNVLLLKPRREVEAKRRRDAEEAGQLQRRKENPDNSVQGNEHRSKGETRRAYHRVEMEKQRVDDT